jgi:primosomal protein N' (replication factor Y)
MWYVEVLVASIAYHKDAPLTYRSPTRLEIGRIVVVPLQNKQQLGIVVAVVGKPEFKVKDILDMPNLPPLPDSLLQLREWIGQYYPAPSGIITQLFLPSALPTKPLDIAAPSELIDVELPGLTKDQQSAVDSIRKGLNILHGETGTGKTRVYIELALQNFRLGRSSIILTPEIGLTSQLEGSFKRVFNDRVVTVHSRLAESKRRQTWEWLLRQTDPVIVIGARSALFSPLRNLGLIVLDEAHETSYKQDQAPYYLTSIVAAKRATIDAAVLVLGSATPQVSDYYFAQAKGRPIIRMTELASGGKAKTDRSISVIDLKDKAEFTKSPHISNTLIAAIKEHLARKEQILLFLNRRGTARIILCENCGWRATCPHCDLPLVYHGDQHLARCHSCSFRSTVSPNCPDCKSSKIILKSLGTKALTEEVRRLFPGARVMRFDTDNKKDETLESNYNVIRSGEVDIIVGTQTLAKGLDLPRLGLVGVIIADTSLYFPDFSAQERTYQLLSQVLGRVARGHRKGFAVIQTYSSNSPLLNAVMTGKWDNFYNAELAERRRFSFPPFCYLLKISCRRVSNNAAQKAAEKFASYLRSSKYNASIEGPTPSFHEKVQGKYMWQIIVKAKNRKTLISIIKALPSGWTYDIDPLNLL